jgi:hypothetical protein
MKELPSKEIVHSCQPFDPIISSASLRLPKMIYNLQGPWRILSLRDINVFPRFYSLLQRQADGETQWQSPDIASDHADPVRCFLNPNGIGVNFAFSRSDLRNRNDATSHLGDTSRV